MSRPDPHDALPLADRRLPTLIYSSLLFLAALSVVGYAVSQAGVMAGGYGWGTAIFFLVYGLFTITMGFPHPGFGHVSFDRVAQVASILVLGPVDAAWINGLASLIYPWHRLANGMSVQAVLSASLHNAGMMMLLIFVCGSLYASLGGSIPLTALDVSTVGQLLLLIIAMQILNDLGMAIMLYVRGESPAKILNVFTTGVELSSTLIAVLVALVYVRMESGAFGLLLVILSLGMFVLKQYAVMRDKLEALVEKRTEELRLKSIELERQATHDKLTGLFNRRYADDFLQREIENTRRHDREFTVALADIDHFKQINDRYSHAVGDDVLRRVANVLVSRCRKTDMVARYGGEEFLLCFPDTSTELAEQICSQIRMAIEREDWSAVSGDDGGDIGITISFGIAQAGDDSRRTTILGDADARLYQAKHKGRNRIVSSRSQA